MLFDPALGESTEASLFDRSALGVGQSLAGPAAITEDETTIIVPASRRAVCQPDGCVEVTRKSE